LRWQCKTLIPLFRLQGREMYVSHHNFIKDWMQGI
jgi:hypothetical protein